jgi:hypothetical protein
VTSRETSFVPIVAQTKAEAHKDEGAGASSAADGVVKASIGSCIEIRLTGAVVRVATGADCILLTQVLRAVRKSAV